MRGDFDHERIKKHLEVEELNAYNHKLNLSEQERKQTSRRSVRTRGKTSKDMHELNEKMDKLAYRVESDVSVFVA